MAAKLSRSDVTSICSAGQKAWDAAPRRARSAPFTWKGGNYVARRTIFRLLIDTQDGQPVACRYV